MRVVVTLLVLILATGWAGFRYRKDQPGLSQVLFGFCILFILLFLGAFFNVL